MPRDLETLRCGNRILCRFHARLLRRGSINQRFTDPYCRYSHNPGRNHHLQCKQEQAQMVNYFTIWGGIVPKKNKTKNAKGGIVK